MRILPLLAMCVTLCAAAQEPKQIYQMTPAEAGSFISSVHDSQPDLRKRIAAIARRNIGQPYKLNLLGEYPYELHDSLPMFSLGQSDCTVFIEHTYAMALSESWEEFFWMLQRIRYKDGVVGVATRNHYTEVDWNINNRWLLTDVSASLPGAAYYDLTVDRAQFLKTHHNTESSIPVQHTREAYVPVENARQAFQQMNEGDMVNVISIRNGEHMVTHVGLVVQDAHGHRRFLHSSAPAVREEEFEDFIARTQARKSGLQLAGFKFLRLNEVVEVPPAAPQPRPQRQHAAAP
ncbi:N-acetylmuramoyl-L-alanine amidase-like domain-containing protein [Pseudoduganella sp. RAF19]|uniref:N-acetylmuramoyl-L-alanine amidase-like domain-containing protein n=1 Tax=Pseudoduganella sp. RAF19 TaxID=3233052 RepID=UPI003F9C77A4